jgi:hypothetical protein
MERGAPDPHYVGSGPGIPSPPNGRAASPGFGGRGFFSCRPIALEALERVGGGVAAFQSYIVTLEALGAAIPTIGPTGSISSSISRSTSGRARTAPGSWGA